MRKKERGPQKRRRGIDSGSGSLQVNPPRQKPRCGKNERIAQGTGIVAKPELGTKRLCAHCGAKFYDLSKNPIVCPKCDTVMELAAVAPRGRPEPVRAPPVGAEEEVAVPETAEAEFVSLEEADAETEGKKAEGEAVEGVEEEVEIEDEGLDDAPFIEEQEEEDEDVTDIIGDVEDEEET
jgi:uncharacterized protein (TIGR02300 family)